MSLPAIVISGLLLHNYLLNHNQNFDNTVIWTDFFLLISFRYLNKGFARLNLSLMFQVNITAVFLRHRLLQGCRTSTHEINVSKTKTKTTASAQRATNVPGQPPSWSSPLLDSSNVHVWVMPELLSDHSGIFIKAIIRSLRYLLIASPRSSGYSHDGLVVLDCYVPKRKDYKNKLYCCSFVCFKEKTLIPGTIWGQKICNPKFIKFRQFCSWNFNCIPKAIVNYLLSLSLSSDLVILVNISQLLWVLRPMTGPSHLCFLSSKHSSPVWN